MGLQHGSQCSDGFNYMRPRVVVQKLSFLHWLWSAEREIVGSRVLVTMGDDVEALRLVKECRELE